MSVEYKAFILVLYAKQDLVSKVIARNFNRNLIVINYNFKSQIIILPNARLEIENRNEP
jgi:hypothetical protein